MSTRIYDETSPRQQHLKSFTDEYRPQGPTESHLVQILADTAWRLNRVLALETNLLMAGFTQGSAPGNDPQQIQDVLSIAAALESQTKALSNLSLLSQRLSLQFERTIGQLRTLQKARREQENHD